MSKRKNGSPGPGASRSNNKKKESACFTLSVRQIVPVGHGQGRRLTRGAFALLAVI